MMAAEVIEPLPFRIREAKDDDFAFIVETWRQSYKHDSCLNRIDSPSYGFVIGRLVPKLRRQVGTMFRVACHADDEDTLFGFAAITPPDLHYVYVKADARGEGIARALLEGVEITSHTFRTVVGERRMKPNERGWKYSPRFTI